MPRSISSRMPPVLGLWLVALLLAPALRAEERAPPPHTSSQVFEALYAEMETAAAEGRVAAATMAAAEKVAFDLRRGLIRSDAEIEVLKLEVARFTGEKQEGALAGLIGAAAAREKLWCDAIRQLEGLAAMPASEEARLQDEEGEESGKKGPLGFSFEPADLIEDPDS